MLPRVNNNIIKPCTRNMIGPKLVYADADQLIVLQGGPWPRLGNETFSVFKASALQWSVIASMESSAYYSCLDDDTFMANFDIKMTYHRKAEVPLLYWSSRSATHADLLLPSANLLIQWHPADVLLPSLERQKFPHPSIPHEIYLLRSSQHSPALTPHIASTHMPLHTCHKCCNL